MVVRAIDRHSPAVGVGGSTDHTDKIRKMREEIVAEERAAAGVEVQRQAELRERVKTSRQAAADARGSAPPHESRRAQPTDAPSALKKVSLDDLRRKA